jgi:hypothetical protein
MTDPKDDRQDLKELLATSKENGAELTKLKLSVTQLKQSLQDITTMEVGAVSTQALNQLKQLLHVGQDTLNEVAQDRILKGIKAGFKDMHFRYESVDSPCKGTFEWIFDFKGNSPESTRFTEWLSAGDGIFHICGKLGSGKSTLMKKLCEHSRTRSELEKWACRQNHLKFLLVSFLLLISA